MSVSVKVNNITNNFYSDEWYTEVETVKKMYDLLGVKGGATVLCPFDTDKSLYVQYGIECGYNVIYNIRDFLDRDVTYEFDFVITNPPFSIKDDVIERCLEYGKPTMLVLPMDSLGGVKRHSLFKSFKSFPKVYIPTRRVNYVDVNGVKRKGACFHSIYMHFNHFSSSSIMLECEEYSH